MFSRGTVGCVGSKWVKSYGVMRLIPGFRGWPNNQMFLKAPSCFPGRIKNLGKSGV